MLFIQWMLVLFVLCAAIAAGFTMVRKLRAIGAPLPAKVFAPLLLIVAPFGWGLWSVNATFGSLFEQDKTPYPSPGYMLAGALFFFGVSFSILILVIFFRSARKK